MEAGGAAFDAEPCAFTADQDPARTMPSAATPTLNKRGFIACPLFVVDSRSRRLAAVLLERTRFIIKHRMSTRKGVRFYARSRDSDRRHFSHRCAPAARPEGRARQQSGTRL